MVDPDREPLEGVVEVDQAEIPFRAGDTFFDPGNAGKILIAGAVEVIDRDTNQAKPRRKRALMGIPFTPPVTPDRPLNRNMDRRVLLAAANAKFQFLQPADNWGLRV